MGRKTNTVPGWPAHKRPDMERDYYGPLPNTNWKFAKHKNRPKAHDQSVNA
jgi:hypothetical protein